MLRDPPDARASWLLVPVSLLFCVMCVPALYAEEDTAPEKKDPNQLTLRFLFAVLLSYALLFAMAAGTVKTTVG